MLPAGIVLRRALIVWGAGHLSLGDRRGWLLLITQPIAIAGLLLVALQLIDGTRWLLIFPPLVALLVIWLGQALHARQRAIELGGVPGGELQVVLFLPLVVVVLTLFWLFGGRHGSPPATLQAYIEAWMAGRPEAARILYARPPAADELAAEWSAQGAAIAQLIGRSRTMYGSASGLDPERPFDSLRFRRVDGDDSPAGDRSGYVGELVRSQRVETTVLGFIPTAGQQTVVVQPLLTIWLRLDRQPDAFALPLGQLESRAWLIESVGWSTTPE